jgi:hypothetical protein
MKMPRGNQRIRCATSPKDLVAKQWSALKKKKRASHWSSIRLPHSVWKIKSCTPLPKVNDFDWDVEELTLRWNTWFHFTLDLEERYREICCYYIDDKLIDGQVASHPKQFCTAIPQEAAAVLMLLNFANEEKGINNANNIIAADL